MAIARGVLSSSELEIDAHQSGTARAGHDVSRMELIVVILVGQIVYVHLQIDVFIQRIVGHGVEDPITGHLL